MHFQFRQFLETIFLKMGKNINKRSQKCIKLRYFNKINNNNYNNNSSNYSNIKVIE